MGAKEHIKNALSEIWIPREKKNIVELGWVQRISYCDGIAKIDLSLPLEQPELKREIEQACIQRLEKLDQVEEVRVRHVAPQKPIDKTIPLTSNLAQGVQYFLAVASGKGGVGKSSVALHLAQFLAQTQRVGLLDCDIYGPSIPFMMGIENTPPSMTPQSKLIPIEKNNISIMSIGLVSEDAPLIWRGPMATQAIRQFLSRVEWGELDVLVLDLPPGTGDIQITLCQTIPISGAIVVTTPQDMSFTISRKALNMFEKLQVPLLGVVTNMASWQCRHCGHSMELFGAPLQESEGMPPILGHIPFDPNLTQKVEEGKNLFLTAAEESPAKKAFQEIGEQVLHQIQKQIQKRKEWESSSNYIRRLGQPTPTQIEVEWGNGEVSRFSAYDLRLSCPCALCVDEWTGERRISPNSIPLDIVPKHAKLVGNYAIQIEWSDGHNAGIYTFTYLHELQKRQHQLKEKSFEI